jgi:hypothetical protein
MQWHRQALGSKANLCHGSPRNHAPTLLRRLPAVVRHCAPWSATTPWHCTTHSHTVGAPHPRKRTAEPSKGRRTTTPRPYGTTPWCQASGSGHLRHHQPCATIPAIATPSRPLHHHPRRCGSVRRQDTATTTTVPRTTSHQRHPRVLTWAALERATSTPPPSKPHLDAHRTRHDAPLEARFARTAVYSMALYAMPPYIARTVRHACKLLPPWPLMHWHTQALGSKANPCHDAPGNHVLALLCRLPAAVRHCAAWSATTLWHCTTHSRTAGAPHPRKRTAEPSKGRRTTTPRPHGTAPWHQAIGSGHLRRHRPCATIPAIATPSRPLHHHPQRCGSVRWQDTATTATVPRTAPRQRHPRVLTRAALEQWPLRRHPRSRT